MLRKERAQGVAADCGGQQREDGEEGEEEAEASEPGGEAALLEVHQGGGHQPRPVHRLVRSHARNQQRARKSVGFLLTWMSTVLQTRRHTS